MPAWYPLTAQPDLVLALGWVLYFSALQWSVVRFKLAIVVVLTASVLLLAIWQWKRTPILLTVRAGHIMLTGSAVATLLVPLFSYLDTVELWTARLLLAGTCLTCMVLLRRARAGRAFACACVGYLMMTVLVIFGDRAPDIDVWVILQQASDGLGRGENFYDMNWVGSPGLTQSFSYLPWSVVLVAPARWLFGDVRWLLALWTPIAVASACRMTEASLENRRRASTVGCLLLLAPGTLTQVDQAWTEPLLLAGIAGWAALIARGRSWLAVLPLALALATKQHLVLLLPVLAVWRPFGWRRTVATCAVAAVLVLPWLVAAPDAFVQGMALRPVALHAILFANTWYLTLLHMTGISMPFWLVAGLMLGVLSSVVWRARRTQPDLAEMLRWMGLLLLIASLVNKQGFYNQYWLAGSLVVLSLALPKDSAMRSDAVVGVERSSTFPTMSDPTSTFTLRLGTPSERSNEEGVEGHGDRLQWVHDA